MPEFPSPERIIAELNDLHPYIDESSSNPRRGEAEAADWLVDFANKWSLGDVRKHPMPRTSRYLQYNGDDQTELANVTIDAGMGDEELLILHGHFDVVPPAAYRNKDIAVVQDAQRLHVYRGLGCYDMLAGVAAILTSLRHIRIASHRSVRAVLVFGEENDSEGTHAAFDARNNLFEFEGGRAALSTEISVGASLEHDHHLIVGRPGRVELKCTVFGKAMHSGGVTPELAHLLVSTRCSKVDNAMLFDIPSHLRSHPKDNRGVMRGAVATRDHTAHPSGGMSTNPGIDFNMDIHYTHPEQGMMQLYPLIRKEIQKVLGDDNFELHQPERSMPWTEPWLEELDNGGHPYPHLIQRFAKSAVGNKQKIVQFKAGTGVADESIIAKHNIPIVCVPPRGEKEHQYEEAVDIRSISEFQIPIIRAAAGYEMSLTDDY